MALDAIGDKWSLLILRDLMFTDKRTYGALQQSDEGIATNILATRLARLEEAGIVCKKPDPADARRSFYLLTEKGIGLLPVVMELMHWMVQHDPEAKACVTACREMLEDRESMIARHQERLRREHLGLTDRV
jgi:DNA-binding HxlR family transcriptional regulator